jgi:hypothetical protein
LDKGFSIEFIEKLKQSNDIVTIANKYITLTKKGKTWWACCPFHFEKTPSFAINEIEQYYHCFGCGASGDVIKFVEKFESLDFYDACKKLAEYAGLELPEFHSDENLVKLKKKRERIYQLIVDAARFYYSNLKLPESRVALDYLAKNNWRSLFEYAVDNGYKTLVKCVLARDVESSKKFLNSLFEYIGDITYPDGAKSNSNHMVLRDRTRAGKDHASKMAFILACKKQIIDDCALQLDMERVTDDLDEAYFRNELAKGNFEIVIIKLCVRLEAILRGKYHLEGDFSEMINQYCSKYGTEDDGWGYNVEAGFVKYLHKLRKCRNGIVHSEKTNETMSIEELKYCIEYICKMR